MYMVLCTLRHPEPTLAKKGVVFEVKIETEVAIA
jgi:hypothetical protein